MRALKETRGWKVAVGVVHLSGRDVLKLVGLIYVELVCFSIHGVLLVLTSHCPMIQLGQVVEDVVQ